MPEIRYLDNAATTPVDPEVAEAMARSLREEYGNPSSLYPLGARAHRLLEEARELMAGMLGARTVVFTGGGTEATNLAMRGQFTGGRTGRILVGAADHPSVLATARALEAEGCAVSVCPVDGRGQLDLAAFGELCGEDLRLVSILYGNNEVGTLPPLETLVALVRDHAPRAHLHVDAVQAFCKVPFDLDRFGIDSASLAAHKIHGPKGVGALALGARRRPEPVITGGGQEQGLRSGTEDVCGIRGFALAAERWISDMAGIAARLEGRRARVLDALAGADVACTRIGDPERCLPHVLSLAFAGISGEVAMNWLAERGLCVSTGSACSQRGDKGKQTGSKVLRAMGLADELVQGTLRISFGRFTTDADVEALCRELPAVVGELRTLGL